MSEPAAQSINDPNAGRSTVFRKRRSAPAQSPHQSRRQAELVQCAWRHFGDAAPMIAFLNAHHEELGARPLTLAIESDDGLMRVEGLLDDLKHKMKESADAQETRFGKRSASQ